MTLTKPAQLGSQAQLESSSVVAASVILFERNVLKLEISSSEQSVKNQYQSLTQKIVERVVSLQCRTRILMRISSRWLAGRAVQSMILDLTTAPIPYQPLHHLELRRGRSMVEKTAHLQTRESLVHAITTSNDLHIMTSACRAISRTIYHLAHLRSTWTRKTALALLEVDAKIATADI